MLKYHVSPTIKRRTGKKKLKGDFKIFKKTKDKNMKMQLIEPAECHGKSRTPNYKQKFKH